MYDLIGDIHGHADELVQLLEKLGYQNRQGIYSHPERKVLFVGDFIDRGSQIRQVLQIVRPMVEEGKALAVMGNHEWNALAYHTEDPESPGDYLRRHSEKNVKQHRTTVEQLSPDELKAYLEWFRKLPMWLELDGLRVVHACWDEQAIKEITRATLVHGGITTPFLQAASKEGTDPFASVEAVLKGKEAALPKGIRFLDEDGNERTDIRTRWYLPPQGKTYGTYALQSREILCDLPLEKSVVAAAAPYPPSARPVFIGHYWLSATEPKFLADNVACVDYSVAKGGFLCAYRWNGETRLSNNNFVWFPGSKRN